MKQSTLDAILDEIRRAEEKWPGWPDDVIHGAAIVAEEAGEVVKAALDCTYLPKGYTPKQLAAVHHRRVKHLRVELAQTAGVCIRMLEEMDK